MQDFQKYWKRFELLENLLYFIIFGFKNSFLFWKDRK